MPTTMTQTEAVLMLLRARGEEGLNPMDALREIGTFRLAARVHDAKELLDPDETIVTETQTVNGKTFARYVLRRKRLPNVEQVPLW